MATTEPLTRKVLAIDFQPAAIKPNWNKVDDLIPQYIEKMKEASGGILVYQLVNKIVAPEYPVLMDGRQYNDVTYAQALADDKTAMRDDHGSYMLADYQKIIDKFNLMQLVANGDIDEVWMFGGPYFGFYESRMVGKGAFWCNGPAMEKDSRRFVIMGFNYEREVREMVHDYGHRSESILAKKFGSEDFLGKLYALKPTPTPANPYEQFLLTHGTVHREPGGQEYMQDEFKWLSAFEAEWWPPTIDPNLVVQPTVQASSASTGFLKFIMDILAIFFPKK